MHALSSPKSGRKWDAYPSPPPLRVYSSCWRGRRGGTPLPVFFLHLNPSPSHPCLRTPQQPSPSRPPVTPPELSLCGGTLCKNLSKARHTGFFWERFEKASGMFETHVFSVFFLAGVGFLLRRGGGLTRSLVVCTARMLNQAVHQSKATPKSRQEVPNQRTPRKPDCLNDMAKVP